MKVGLKKGTIVHGRFITTSFFRSSTEKPFSMKKLFRLSETAAGIEERYEVEIETMGMDKNHIHLLCGAHPKLSPGRIVQIFKSITAREIFTRKPSVKKHLWGGEFWTDGYYVATVGERSDWKTVERYIQK